MSNLVAPNLHIPSLGHSPSGGSASGLGFSPVSVAPSGHGHRRVFGSESMLAPSLSADSTQRLIAELHASRQGPTPTSATLGSYRSFGSGLGTRLGSPQRATSPTNAGVERLLDDRTLATSSSMPQFRRTEDMMYNVDLNPQLQASATRTISSGSPGTSTSSDEDGLLKPDVLSRAYGVAGNFPSGLQGEVGYVMPNLRLDGSSNSGSSVSSNLSGSASASRAQAAAEQLAKAKASYEQAVRPEGSIVAVNSQILDGSSQNGSSRQQFSVDLTVPPHGSAEGYLQATTQDSSPLRSNRSRIRSSLPSNLGASMRTHDQSDAYRRSEGMINVDLMSSSPLRHQGDLENSAVRSQQELMPASSSTSFPLRTSSKEGSVVGSSVGFNGFPASDTAENLTQALTAFGAPSEWYHDSIILGRLSALALRYFHAKAARRPWQAWRSFTRSGLNRKRNFLRSLTLACRRVALRKFRWQVLATDDRIDDRRRNIGWARKMPLINALSNLPSILLRPTWVRLRQAIFLRRDLHRRLRLLNLIDSKMKQMLARTHYYQHLQRLGLAGFWLAKEVRINSHFPSPARRHTGASTVGATSLHVAQVLRRSWRRWFYGVRLWLSSAEYAVRETELWLTGEISTPRDIVTNSVMQVVSPETHVADLGLSANFLGYGGAWNLGRHSSTASRKFTLSERSSPKELRSPEVLSYQDEEDQLLLPFPHMDFDQTKDDGHRSLEGTPEGAHADRRHRSQRKASPVQLDGSSRTHYENLIASFRNKVQAATKPRRKAEEETEVIPVPPTRTRRSLVFEQTRQVAIENEIDRSRREYEEEESRMLESPLPAHLADEHSARSPRHQNRSSPLNDEDDIHRRDRRHSSSLGQFNQVLADTHSDDDMEFVSHDSRRRHEGHPSKPMSFDQGGYDFGHDPANDYWALRNRRGPGIAPKQISLRRPS